MKNLRVAILVLAMVLIETSLLFAEPERLLNLVSISSSKAVIHWETSELTSCTFSYGQNPWDLDQKIVEIESQIKHQVVLTNLKSNSRYFSQVNYYDKSDKKVKKVPPSPLQIKTLARDEERNTLTINSSEIIAAADTCLLLKITISEPGIIELKYGNEKRSLKNIKKSNFYGLTHYIIIESPTDLRNTYYSVSAENIFGYSAKSPEPQLLKIDGRLNLQDIPDEYKLLFNKENVDERKTTERGVRSRRIIKK